MKGGWGEEKGLLALSSIVTGLATRGRCKREFFLQIRDWVGATSREAHWGRRACLTVPSGSRKGHICRKQRLGWCVCVCERARRIGEDTGLRRNGTCFRAVRQR